MFEGLFCGRGRKKAQTTGDGWGASGLLEKSHLEGEWGGRDWTFTLKNRPVCKKPHDGEFQVREDTKKDLLAKAGRKASGEVRSPLCSREEMGIKETAGGASRGGGPGLPTDGTLYLRGSFGGD